MAVEVECAIYPWMQDVEAPRFRTRMYIFSFRLDVVFRLHASAPDVALDFTLFALRDT